MSAVEKKSFGLGSHMITSLVLFPAIFVLCIWRDADMPWWVWLFFAGIIFLFLWQMSKIIIYPDRICRIYYFFWKRNQSIYLNDIVSVTVVNGIKSEAVDLGLLKRGQIMIIEDNKGKKLKINSNYIDRFEGIIEEMQNYCSVYIQRN